MSGRASSDIPHNTGSTGLQQTPDNTLVTQIDALLPQTQCTQCGYNGCKPYAVAIANNEADINQCPPGGDKGIHKLARLLKRDYKPLNPDHGVEKPKALAVIDEPLCIGCTLCIQACPVDAIVGAAKLMHTVIADHCTGCELCVAPCPVDCIRMEPIPPAHLPNETEQVRIANTSRQRHQFHLFRIARDKAEKAERLAAKIRQAATIDQTTPTEVTPAQGSTLASADAKKALIAAAMERARQQREAMQAKNTDPKTLDASQQAEIERIEARRAANRSNEGHPPSDAPLKDK